MASSGRNSLIFCNSSSAMRLSLTMSVFSTFEPSSPLVSFWLISGSNVFEHPHIQIRPIELDQRVALVDVSTVGDDRGDSQPIDRDEREPRWSSIRRIAIRRRRISST